MTHAFLWVALTLPLAVSGLAAQRKQLVFVENTHGGDVSIIDDATHRVVGSIEVGLSPDDIVSSADGKTLFVSRIIQRADGRPAAPGEPLGEVVAIDPIARKVTWRAPLTGVPNHLMASSDGRFVYVTIVSGNHLDVVDLAKRAVVGRIEVGTGPHDIELSADAKRGYVGLIRGSAVTLFDAVTRRATKTIPTPQDARPIQVTADERTMYVQLSWTHGFVVLDLDAGKVVRSVAMPIPEGESPPDSMPWTPNHGLRLADNGRVLIANGSMYDYVAFYSVPDLTLLGTVPVGNDPNWVTLTPDGTKCYVSNRGSDDVSVIDIATRAEVARIKVGSYPQRMAIITVGGG
jgi:YVTN family beta-propeller protein